MDTDICEIKEYFDSGTISDEVSALILNDLIEICQLHSYITIFIIV